MDIFAEWMKIGPRQQTSLTDLMDIAVREESSQDGKVNSIQFK